MAAAHREGGRQERGQTHADHELLSSEGPEITALPGALTDRREGRSIRSWGEMCDREEVESRSPGREGEV